MDIRVRFPGGRKVDAELEDRDFVVRTDQSKLNGGDESAPAPYQLFLASIATCVGVTILSFCQSRNLPTDGIEIVQRQEYDESGKRLTKVKLSINAPASFPDRYRNALVRVAGLCSVKKAIADPPEFDISLNGA
jgi:putative redox protein